MIQVNHVFHDYEGKGNCAVSDISFTVEGGSIFGFLGPSGAGKSTIQNIMTGLLPLQRGEVLYDGASVRGLKTRFFNQIGVSFEQSNLYSSLTGLENLRYYAALFSVPTIKPMELLERVGLREDANKRVSNYSKGMRQRLTFARALLNRPQYLFLDEPTSGLDPKTAVGIRELINEQKQRGDSDYHACRVSSCKGSRFLCRCLGRSGGSFGGGCTAFLYGLCILAFDFLFLHEPGKGIACKLRVFLQGFVILEVHIRLERCLFCLCDFPVGFQLMATVALF